MVRRYGRHDRARIGGNAAGFFDRWRTLPGGAVQFLGQERPQGCERHLGTAEARHHAEIRRSAGAGHHGLVNNGSRWHVRAFDRRRKEFNDFVLTRIGKVEERPESPVLQSERVVEDIQWTRIVELELVPHPHQPRPEIACMDFNMREGVLKWRESAALVGYLLRQWNVDCSPKHTERSPSDEKSPDERKGEEIRLWLRNYWALYGVSSARMAPGHVPPL